MRRLSGITNINSPEAISSDKMQLAQTDRMEIIEINEYNPERTGMNIQPYRTNFRNIYK